MSENHDSYQYQIVNLILASLFQTINIPSEFHEQVKAIKTMLSDDVSGLIDVLTDFAVSSASVNFSIESENEELNKTLKNWLDTVNINYKGRIPVGIRSLAKEYFKERWKYSSFPVLKIAKWEDKNGIVLPTELCFVKGESIYSKDLDENDEDLKLINYDYYLGSKMDEKSKLDSNVIFSKPYGRWFDEYPTPYLIKRGIYHNWLLIQSLKKNQAKILDQIIPYLLHIKKGSPELFKAGIGYSDIQLQEILDKIKELMVKTEELTGTKKISARATNFDEEIKHLIPDLETAFKESLFTVLEKNILSGLGFIDIAEGVSSSRKESILNPKVFIGEVKDGVEDFKQILFQLLMLIKEKNSAHVKYMNTDFHISSSPITIFTSDDFKDKIRQLYDRGRISSQTAVEIIAETDFTTEIYRRKREAIQGIESEMYPPIIRNDEEKGIDIPNEQPSNIDEEEIPDDKKGIEKENYDVGSYEAPVKCAKCGYIFDMLAEVEIAMGAVACPKCGNAVTQANLINKNSKKYNCECIKCGYKTTSDKHCKDLTCPKCKGEMRRVERPGQGNPDSSELEGAPYKTVKELPKSVQDNLDIDLQRVFLKVFNNAYNTYNNDTMAIRVAWNIIKKLGRKDKNGKWRRKSKRENGKLKQLSLTKAMVEEALEKTEKETINEVLESKKLEIAEKQSELLTRLLKNREEK